MIYDALKDLETPDGQPVDLPPPPAPACAPGEFIFAATGMEHGHIHGMCQDLAKAGGTLKWVFEPDAAKRQKLLDAHPGAQTARALDEILDDPAVRLVAAADVPSRRAALGIRVMQAGKDYYTDKAPCTTLEQLEAARAAAAATGRKYMVAYSERLNSESAILAGHLVELGLIGRVVNVAGFGPHRLGPPASRPDWFFKKELTGGIICDIGSHQCEQFIAFTKARAATVNFARAVNLDHPAFPELEDLGEASITADNGASFYFRVDWFTPNAFRTWGDARTIILGTQGMIELRKNVDLATDNGTQQLYLVNGANEIRINARGTVGHPFYANLIRDCLDRTETAMTQAHAFLAAELCLRLQAAADAARG